MSRALREAALIGLSLLGPALAALLLAVLVLLAFAFCTGCHGAPRGTDAEAASAPALPPGDPVVVAGTVIEAATGKPVPGASVHGPAGSSAVADAHGRFELALVAGMEGPLAASSAALRGENRLLPLEPGRLEVVIYLR